MRILIVNPILYTSETENIKKIESIKDTMIVGLCNEFVEQGNDVTLYSCESYKPLENDNYKFKLIFDKVRFKKIFKPHRIPFMANLKKYLKKSRNDFDLIIASESFSLSTYLCCKYCPNKTIIWQELAKHNNMFNQNASKIWYKVFFNKFKDILVVPRSPQAKKFISKYTNNISEEIIDHGVDLKLFRSQTKKRKQFIVVSQLIQRKRIDTIILKFIEFLNKFDDSYKLIIAGDGNDRNKLEKLAEVYLNKNIIFLGKLDHEELVKYISDSTALLINTEKDNNLISIVESLACCTPVVVNRIPYNIYYIEPFKLGIVENDWNYLDLIKMCNNNSFYVKNCENYLYKLSYSYKVNQFISIYNQEIFNENKGEKNEE